MAIWYSPADPTAREVCPCCDYVSLAERGNYLICPVCFWEDDSLDVDQLDQHSGPNHMTLREGRANFAKFGACDQGMIPNVCSPESGRSSSSGRDMSDNPPLHWTAAAERLPQYESGRRRGRGQ